MLRRGRLFAVAVLVAASSCRVSQPSNYSLLPARAQGRVQPYAAGAWADSVVQELTAADVRALSREHAYTWVVTWAPWCEPWQRHAEQFKEYQRRLADRDINLVFVDIAYSPATASGANASLRGNRPAYVVNGRRYGPGADVKFRQELAGASPQPSRVRYAAHFVLNRQQQVVLIAKEPALVFERLRAATGPPATP
ncbi:MAG TPA: hypothetical protein VF629_03010 [Hymenobacter sp.]|jgi:hypothetical protein|uniref:hypothetical protein n=1 Tax=Hymenobacter sp. TaxID=1898978 RepID=UPI002ED91285